MSMILCEKNHLYDSEKFLSCPHCANALSQVDNEDLLGKNQHNVSTAMSVSTILSEAPLLHRKTVGWLVCISGAIPGESFCLREGENHIGRNANMDVALLHEPTVSRKSHAIITYDTARHNCILYAGENPAQTFCNERTIKTKKVLRNRDVIRLGACCLVFVPFCNASFSWASDTK